MQQKINIISCWLILLLTVHSLSSCSRPEVTPPSVEPLFKTYLTTLEKGDLKDVRKSYFMPLHWRRQQKLYNHFSQQHQLLTENKLSLTFLDFKQKGRWAVAALKKNESGVNSISPLWFFFYDDHWQVVSPVIFKTAPVRSMIDLFREQKKLRSWYYAKYPSNNYPSNNKAPVQ